MTSTGDRHTEIASCTDTGVAIEKKVSEQIQGTGIGRISWNFQKVHIFRFNVDGTLV